MKRKVVYWAVIGVLLCGMPAWGEKNKPEENDSTMIEQIVVTAGRIEESKADVSTNISIISEWEIEESMAQDLGDLLSKQGFMVREYPNSGSAVNVRSFLNDAHGNELSGHVLILINGHRAGTGNLSQLSMDNVERVEVIRGPGSTQYGPLAIGGVINVITKQGKDKPSAYIEGTVGSWDYQKTRAGFSGADDRFDYTFSVSKETQDNYTTADGDTYLNTGYEEKYSISLNAGWSFLTNHRVAFCYNNYIGQGIGSPSYLSDNDEDDFVDNSIDNYEITYDGESTDHFLLWRLTYFTGHDQYETFDPTKYGNSHKYIRNKYREGAQSQITAQWDHAHITTGLDWTHYTLSNTYTIEGKGNDYNNPAAFLMAKLKLFDDKLILSAGGREDGYQVKSDDGKQIEKENWSSNIGIIYKFTPDLSIRANYAEGFKMPTADQLYMFNDYGAMGVWKGNEDLKPEKSNTFEVGLDMTRETFEAGLTFFHTNFKDKIAYQEKENWTEYMNIDGSVTAGIEGNMQWDIGTQFDWPYEVTPYGSFSYLTRSEDLDTNENLLYSPQWTGSYGLRLAQADAGFTARLNFSFVDSQDINDYEGTGDTTLKGYTVADLAISKTLCAFKENGQIKLLADIRNLFNENYAPVQGYFAPGRSFYMGLKYIY